MSQPKSLKRYSSEWFALFDAFKENPVEAIEIDCGTNKKAQAMRLEFYKTREAFLHDPGMAKIYEDVLNSREVKVRDEKCIFDHKDKNWIGQLLAQSLGGTDATQH